MTSLVIYGDTSGAITLQANSVAGTNTITLPNNTGTVVTTGSSNVVTPTMLTQPLTRGAAQNSTTGTSITFTGIPSWAKRITVMFQGVSTNGTSAVLVRLGTSGGVVSSGYLSTGGAYTASTPLVAQSTTGFVFEPAPGTSSVSHGSMVITNITGNSWVEMCSLAYSDAAYVGNGGGSIALSDTLTQLSVATSNGTDTFDAGVINILYE